MTESHKRQKTKLLIENAMVDLLQHTTFDQITTVKLAEAAGISRSSFYTHYKDKYDMINHYQDKLFHNFEYIFNKHSNHHQHSMTEVLEYLKREPLLAALLSENGTKEIQNILRHKLYILLGQDIQGHQAKLKLTPIEREYSRIYLTNALFGVVQTWIAKGTKESPEEMTNFFMKMLGKGK